MGKLTSITVKGIDADVWKEARRDAIADGEKMTEYVNKALIYYRQRKFSVENLVKGRRVRYSVT